MISVDKKAHFLRTHITALNNSVSESPQEHKVSIPSMTADCKSFEYYKSGNTAVFKKKKQTCGHPCAVIGSDCSVIGDANEVTGRPVSLLPGWSSI